MVDFEGPTPAELNDGTQTIKRSVVYLKRKSADFWMRLVLHAPAEKTSEPENHRILR